MRMGRKLASLGAAVAIAGAAAFTGGANAFAAAGITATSVDEGAATTITVSGCDDSTMYSGATVSIVDSSGATVATPTLSSSWTISWTAADADIYTATVTCLGYNGTANSTASAQFAVWPTYIDITPDSWTEGQAVTLQAVGFEPGEQVKLVLTAKDGTVIQTWATAGSANANGLWSFKVTFPHLKAGTYYIAATGLTSGVVREGGFTIGGSSSGDTGSGGAGTKPGKLMPGTGN